MGKPHFYHYATEGLKDDVLFGSVAEFIAGMNRIAVCLCRLGPAHPVQVICFVRNSGSVIMAETTVPGRSGESDIGSLPTKSGSAPQSPIFIGILLPQGWHSLPKDIAGAPHRSCSPT